MPSEIGIGSSVRASKGFPDLSCFVEIRVCNEIKKRVPRAAVFAGTSCGGAVFVDCASAGTPERRKIAATGRRIPQRFICTPGMDWRFLLDLKTRKSQNPNLSTRESVFSFAIGPGSTPRIVFPSKDFIVWTFPAFIVMPTDVLGCLAVRAGHVRSRRNSQRHRSLSYGNRGLAT